jgi:tRNA(Ile)-lysidine synthase
LPAPRPPTRQPARAALAAFAASPVVAVAVSGGRDSTALLHATSRAAFGTGIQVLALHVNHGLQADADRWLAHLRAQCRRWAAAGLPLRLDWRHLAGQPAPGDSVEAWARRQRYAALAEMARAGGAELVLLAHHRRDQAETVLLQTLRGGGPAGLAAMPREARREGLVWARPWLDRPREAIEAYVRRHRLGFITDDSNADPRYARNRLRLSVWPALIAAFPDSEAALVAAARRAQEAADCLRELAAADLALVGDADGGLKLPDWQGCSAARRANLLRVWLAPHLPEGVPESLVQRLLRELPGAPGARWQTAAGELRCHAGVLRLVTTQAEATCALPAALPIDLSQPGRHPVPAWAGAWVVERVEQGGLAALRLREVELRPRLGGEQFQRAPNSLPRSLKKQFQAAGLPSWQRDGPLLYGDGELLCVPGLGIDARRRAATGVPQRRLCWVPDAVPVSPRELPSELVSGPAQRAG